MSRKSGLIAEGISTRLRELYDNQSESGEISNKHAESDDDNFLNVVASGSKSDKDIEINVSQLQNEFVVPMAHSENNVVL